MIIYTFVVFELRYKAVRNKFTSLFVAEPETNPETLFSGCKFYKQNLVYQTISHFLHFYLLYFLFVLWTYFCSLDDVSSFIED